MEILPASCEISYQLSARAKDSASSQDTEATETASAADSTATNQGFELLSAKDGRSAFVPETDVVLDRANSSSSLAHDSEHPLALRSHAYNMEQFEAAYPVASWEVAAPAATSAPATDAKKSEVSSSAQAQVASDEQAVDSSASDEASRGASAEALPQQLSQETAESAPASAASSDARASDTQASDTSAAGATVNEKTQAMSVLDFPTHEKKTYENPEDQIISEIHRDLNQAKQAQDGEAVAQALQEEQEILGGSANKNMAMRAALFDLPDPLQETNDPFATGTSAPLTEDRIAQAAAETQQSADAKAPVPTPASAVQPAQSPATQAALRSKRLFGKKKKKDDQDESMSSWLGVEEGYDAKKDGREIGSWDNFVHEGDAAAAPAHADKASNKHKGSSHWKGGAATRKGLRPYPLHEEDAETSAIKDGELDLPTLDELEPAQGENVPPVEARVEGSDASPDQEPEVLSLKDNPFVKEGVVELFQKDTPAVVSSQDQAEQSAASATDADSAALEESEAHATSARKPSMMDMQEKILSMGEDELLCHDIWFVALGAGEHNHAGMKQFLSEHRRDIRGAFLINLSCIGAGSLSVLTEEDNYNTRHADKRLVRLIQSVAKDLHIGVNKVKYDFGTTDATPAMHASVRAATLMGCDANDLPSLSHTADDTASKIDPDQVAKVSQLICELIRRS